MPLDYGEWEAVTALLLESETKVLILYPTAASTLYQQHSIFHEFGHMLAEETECDILDLIPRDLVEAAGMREAIVRSAARGLEVGEHELMAEAVAYALARKLISGSHGRESAFGL
ncbi:hypothetical protein QMG83_15360 [Salinibacterium sp. G-O1]|uniref:hypothetical protein n=1 Tax=Salinibacterium sp. G-O1 TaxID=3046208 RepID=UPI0024BB1F3C|nr:hypothetical protein [Salinibacterium sp. G-O1]MDJ0336606.1 hypothetical protein [Salinibacterium sp. G-O1]